MKQKLQQWEKKVYRDLIIQNDLMALHKNLKLNEMALKYNSVLCGNVGVIFSSQQDIENIRNQYNSNIWRECENMQHSKNSVKKRLKSRTKYLLELGTCLFLTLTFNDLHYNSTSESTKWQYAKHYLEDLQCKYICNHDYGEQYERFHFHAIIQKDYISEEEANKWRKYGNINFKLITTPNEKALAEYVLKFTNHALKDSTKQHRIHYSKGFFNNF